MLFRIEAFLVYFVMKTVINVWNVSYFVCQQSDLLQKLLSNLQLLLRVIWVVSYHCQDYKNVGVETPLFFGSHNVFLHMNFQPVGLLANWSGKWSAFSLLYYRISKWCGTFHGPSNVHTACLDLQNACGGIAIFTFSKMHACAFACIHLLSVLDIFRGLYNVFKCAAFFAFRPMNKWCVYFFFLLPLCMNWITVYLISFL